MDFRITVLFSAVLFFASASVGVTLPVKQSEKKNVTAGEKITLLTGITGLHGEYSVLLYLINGTQKETLITCDGEKVECDSTKRFEGKLHLDPKSGSLTIGPLNVDDSGVYEVQVTNGNNNEVHTQAYEVTVSESKTTTGSQNSAHYQRSHLAAVVPFLVFVAFVISLAWKVLSQWYSHRRIQNHHFSHQSDN